MNLHASSFENKIASSNRLNALAFLLDMDSIIENLKDISLAITDVITIEDANLSSHLLNELKLDSCSMALLDNKLYHIESGVELFDKRQIGIIGHGNIDKSRKEVIDQIKSDIGGICKNSIVIEEEISNSFCFGIAEIHRVLEEIIKKKKSIKDSQYEDFWLYLRKRNEDIYSDRINNDYEEWKSEHHVHHVELLKDKMMQEVMKLVDSGLFSHDTKPSNRELRNKLFSISEEALEDGNAIPENFDKMLAQFERYVVMKDGEMKIDSKKIGKYLYTHCPIITQDELDAVIYFDYMLELINHGIREAKEHAQELKKTRKSKDPDINLHLVIKLINSCKIHLADGVSEDILESYVTSLFNSDIKHEVLSKMQKESSKYKMQGILIGMMKSTQRVFRTSVTSGVLANSLYDEDMDKKKRSKDSWRRYIDEGAKDQNSALARWTKNFVKQRLKNSRVK